MSAFLGPIHYWLYNKIQLQEEMICKIVDLAEEKQWISEGELRKKYVHAEKRDLEDLIDTDNIHGWLQGQITDAETRYAALVSQLLKDDPARKEALLQLAFSFGKEHAVQGEVSVNDIYRKLEDSF